MIEDRVRPGFWFKPKAFGYGATPATWQGWLVVALFVLLTGLIVRLAMPRHPLFLLMLVPLTLGLIWISWAKTDGAWRWRP